MRIVQYHPRALVGDGGISNSVRRLSAAMVEAGADVAIAHQAGPATSPFAADAGGATWAPVHHRGWRGTQVPTDLGTVLAGADVMILNSAWTAHNFRAGQVAIAHGVPYVVADRGAYDPSILRRRRRIKRAWWRVLESRVVHRALAMHLFFASEEHVIRRLGFAGDIIVAPNGVGVPTDAVWDGGSGGYILFIGRFDPEHKGLDLLVQAVAAAPAQDRPQVRLYGPDWRGGKAKLKALVSDLDVEPWVQIGPAVYGQQKWQLLTAAAGFVYPSRWEAFGNSVAEAAAIGLPVLVTPYPLGQYLAAHDAAVLADATVDGLVEGLRRLRSPEGTQAGTRAAALVRDGFTWEAVADAWLAQLERLMS